MKGIFSCFLFLFICLITVQSLLAQEFPVGVFAGSTKYRGNDSAWQVIKNLGVNTVVQYLDDVTKPFIDKYNLNLIADNEESENDVINHYARSYYSKWEAEENNPNTLATGFHHKSGFKTKWSAHECWTNGNIRSNQDSMIWGPGYYQDKIYRHDLYNVHSINYNVKFNLAASGFEPLDNLNDTICILKVKFIYKKNVDGVLTVKDTVLASSTLRVANFPDTSFKEINLKYNYSGISDNIYIDNKISFQVDYCGHGTLFVDYVEVWDNDIWGDYIRNPDSVKNKVLTFAAKYDNWNKLKFWYAADEPQTLDLYIPMKTIESLLRSSSVNYKHLITEFYPQWDGWKNGDKTIRKFVNQVQPGMLMIDFFPYWIDLSDEQGLSLLKDRLQEAYEAAKNRGAFYYVAQTFGQRDSTDPKLFRVWRKPNTTELNASVMLALSHGIKGLMFWNYWSYLTNEPTCSCKVWQDCIVDTAGKPTELYSFLQNSLIPRLKGILGNILLNLDYTGNFIHETGNVSNPGRPDSVTQDYLTLIPYGTDYDFHAGLFTPHSKSDNKFFMLVNLRTDGSREVKFSINNNSGYKKLRVTDYENPLSFDKFITAKSTFILTLPAGEGRLFQLTPVLN